MLIPLSDIHIPTRIREGKNTLAAVEDRIMSLLEHSQISAITVEPFGGDKPWLLIDGGVRHFAMKAITSKVNKGDLSLNEDGFLECANGQFLKPGHLEATVKEGMKDIDTLMMEFHANHDREDFTWQETGEYIRRCHDMLVDTTPKGKKWTAKDTAQYISTHSHKVSAKTVSQYLRLTSDDEAAQSEKVQSATTFRTATKQFQIQKERKRKKFEAENRARREKIKVEKEASGDVDYDATAGALCINEDSRDVIARIPDDSLDWVHWDPPYGGREGAGGAFAAHGGAETEWDYAISLMDHMIPEIWRVLKPGAWLVIWYTPVYYQYLLYRLHGHEFDDDGICPHCDRHIWRDREWLVQNYSCRPSPFRFWTNPFDNAWLKTDREADGHEITRFLIKDREPFLLAGKDTGDAPILMHSDAKHTFQYPLVPASERRHANHKNPDMLSEVLSLITAPGSLGADFGAGSGSIGEAAWKKGREVIMVETSEEHYEACLTLTLQHVIDRDLGHPEDVVNWLPEITQRNITTEDDDDES